MEYTIHVNSAKRSKEESESKFSIVANKLSIDAVCGFKPSEVSFTNFSVPNHIFREDGYSCYTHEIYIQIDPLGYFHHTLDGKGAACIIPITDTYDPKMRRCYYTSSKKYKLNTSISGNALHIRVEDPIGQQLKLSDWSFDIIFYE